VAKFGLVKIVELAIPCQLEISTLSRMS
jgi:hypothetical protein